ncbi:MAG: DUF4359 domain-containing protein [Calothrix sp. MO_167.B42]|nr:DUF4359 domain-containing protein [Calothrix sp. MO_167.B42]
MKPANIITYTGTVGLAVLGILMAITNPSQPKYEQYAVLRLTEYLKDNVCVKSPSILENLVNINCNKLVDKANPQIKELIAATTKRHNYVIFSVYRTDLELNSWVPGYTFETMGAFNNFYIYKAQKR